MKLAILVFVQNV